MDHFRILVDHLRNNEFQYELQLIHSTFEIQTLSQFRIKFKEMD